MGRNIVLFLGAGFSADAGHPTMAGFGAASRSELQAEIKQWSGTGYETARKIFTNAGRTFERFQVFCGSTRRFGSVDVDNMEEVSAIAEMLEYVGQDVELSDPTKTAKVLSDEIYIWLWKVYHVIPALQEGKSHLAGPYATFVKLLKELAGRTTILTTNYDLTLEHHAYADAGMRCRYPLVEAQDYEVERVGEETEVYVGGVDGRTESESPIVCKLHGSVNFVECKNKLSILTGWNGPNGSSSRAFAQRPTMTEVSPMANLIESRGFVPVIVPPTYAKLAQADWLRKIYKAAFEALARADALVFIGYSFPNSDGFMRGLIQAALAKRVSNSPPKIWIVDPSAAVHERYRLLFWNIPQLNSMRLRFKDALDNGDIPGLFAELQKIE